MIFLFQNFEVEISKKFPNDLNMCLVSEPYLTYQTSKMKLFF